MESFSPISDTVPLVLSQQGTPIYGNREAYENGRMVGRITTYVMIGVVVVWGILKIFRKK